MAAGDGDRGRDADRDEQAHVAGHLDRLLTDYPPATTPDREFWGAQYDLGLAWVRFPEGFGGLDVSPRWQIEVDRRIVDAGGSVDNRYRNIIGIGMGAGTLAIHGTEEQRRRWLRPMFTTEEIWCQLFSEPGAGSDVAALATRAVRDGDRWIVTGRKVWTTLAHLARWGLLLARTDPDVPKHAGLTYFVVDLTEPGVEVRPLYQITGEAEFNEVVFTDAAIPDDHRIGGVGEGWAVAMTTLMNERVAIGSNIAPRGTGAIAHAVAAWQRTSHRDPAKRDALLAHWVEAEALRLTTLRAQEAARRGTPGPDGSTAKLHWAELNQAITAFAVDLLGAEGMTYPAGYAFTRPDVAATRTPDLHKAYLRARANSIEGGTSEIMKNILGERVLGLPGEPRVDKGIPWRDLPRG